ncbi:MAG TPA: hypothetical protein PKI61_01430 [bacterium]|nr:hypothetical protein [bacterium]HPT29548.1 hypothetical protein [bacterium]
MKKITIILLFFSCLVGSQAQTAIQSKWEVEVSTQKLTPYDSSTYPDSQALWIWLSGYDNETMGLRIMIDKKIPPFKKTIAAKSMTSLFNLNNLKNSLAIIETEKKFFQEKGIYEIIINTINAYKPSGVFMTNLYFAPEDKDHLEPLVLGLVDFTTSNPDFCYVPPKSR